MDADKEVTAIFESPLLDNQTKVNEQITTGTWRYYYATVPANATSLTFATSNATADVDIYTQIDAIPTFSSFICNQETASGNETCTTTTTSTPALRAGTWWLAVYSCCNDATYSVTATIAAPKLTVTPQVGANGSISPTTPQQVIYQTTASFTVTPNTGYNTNSTVGGTCPQGTWNADIWTTGSITANCTVIFDFTIQTYTTTATATTTGGTLTPTSQQINHGSTATFTLTPNTGYSKNPTVGGTCPQGTWNGNVWTTGPIIADCTLNFSFTLSTYTVTTNIAANGTPNPGGTIDPSAPQQINHGSTASFTVSPSSGYNRSDIVGGTCPQGTWIGKIWTTGPITANCTVQFTFTPSGTVYTVTPTIGTGGTVNPNTPQTIPHGLTATFTVTANTGYTHNTTVTGTCPQGTWNGDIWTTGAIVSNCTVNFGFTLKTYTVTPTAGTGGTINPNTPQTVNHGATKAFTVTANTGYNTNTTVGGTCPTGTWSSNVYTTGVITADCTVTFAFTLKTYTVTPTAGAGGTVTPNTPQTVNHGATKAFTVTANTGYNTNNAVTGTCPTGSWSGTVYTTGAVTTDCTVTFSFILKTYTVTPTAGTGSTVNPNTPQTVNHGATKAFTVTANTGYNTNNTVDAVGGSCPAGTWNGTVYTTGAITADCTVIFSFTLKTYTVTPTVGAGGTVNPNTPQTVNHGATKDFTVTANTGYNTNSTVGGTCPAGTWSDNVYTTGVITADCTVEFTFAYGVTVTITPPNGGTVNPNTIPVVVQHNATTQLTLTPNSGYTINPIVGGTCPKGSWNSTNFTTTNTWSTGPIVSNCTVVFDLWSKLNSAIAQTNQHVNYQGWHRYSIDVPNGTASLTCQTSDATDNTDLDLYLRLNSKPTTKVYDCAALSASGNEECTIPTPAAGTWYVGVYGFDDAADYTIACTIFYTVTATATPPAAADAIDPPTQEVALGDTAQITISPTIAYTRNDTVAGTCPQGSWNDNVWTTGPIVANCTVEFSFTLKTYAITTIANPSAGGTLTCTPNPVEYGGDSTCTAMPADGYNLANFSGACTGSTCTLTNVTSAKNVTANFALKQYTLSLNKTGTGTGTITSTPTGINCGTDCAKLFTHGTTITLTATAATDSTFGGWNGANCTGIDTCTLTITADAAITANFETTIPTTCGKIWTTATSNFSYTIYGITWNGSQFVAVGNGGTVLTSSDGATWSLGSTGDLENLTAVTWTGTQFVAVAGYSGESYAYTSPNATNWTKNTVGDRAPHSVVWNGEVGKLVIVGDQGAILTSDAAAQTWTTATTPVVTTLNAITLTNNQYVAVGVGSTILTSADGNTWTLRSGAGTSLNLSTVLWNGYQFLTAGGNTILASTDGTTWSQLTTTGLPSGLSLYHIIWNGSRYLSVGSTGGIFTSVDGRTWYLIAASTAPLRNMIWNGSQLIAVGNNGTILRSDCTQTQATPEVQVSYDPVLSYNPTYGQNVQAVNAIARPGSSNYSPTGSVDFYVNGVRKVTFYDIEPDIGATYLTGTLNNGDQIEARYLGDDRFRPVIDYIDFGQPASPLLKNTGENLNYPLTVTVAGTGTITTPLAPLHIQCKAANTGDCKQNYPKHRIASVALRAIPDNGYSFTGWSGSGCSGTSDTCTVAMDSARTITATFATRDTATAPSASTDPASNVTTTSATLKGWVNDNGAATEVTFDFGTTTSYGTNLPATPVTITANTGATAVIASRTGLQSGTTYHYRVRAVNSSGTTLGDDRSFTTTSLAVNPPFCQQCLPSMQGWRSAVALLRQIPNSRRTRNMAIHKITPSTGVGGTIIPNTMRLVLTGTRAQFTITPEAGNTATVIGTCGGIPTTGTVAFTYTTNPVSRDCTIGVSFAASLNKAALDTMVYADTTEPTDQPVSTWQDDHTVYNAHTMGGIHAPADLNTQTLPTSGSSAFDFTKLDTMGHDLPADAATYTCLRDNATGLIWESKTQDGGLQDQNWSYTWYDSSNPGGNAGTSSGGICYTVGRCDSEKYTHDINARGLCGGKDWRLPTIAELATIANSPLTQHQPPTWAAFDPSLVDGYNAMVVDFVTGHIDPLPRSVGNAVLLVR